MDSHALQDFQSALTCSICMNYFLEPVTIDCGHTLCQPCLYFFWDEAQTPRCCPQCREIVKKTDYRTNTVVKKLASLARQARPCSVSSSGEQLCRRNGETKGLFCKVDKSLLSAPCSESPEHMDCVVEENRDYVILRMNMIKVQYQMMHQFLLEEERFQLGTLEREAQEILQQLIDSAIRMAQHREKLKEMYRELMELCHKSDMELLQVTKDLGDIFERLCCTHSFYGLQPSPNKPDKGDFHKNGVAGDAEAPASEPRAVFITHHWNLGYAEQVPSTQWTYMSLPDEVRNRIFGVDGATENPQTLESYVIWGVEAFNCGKHYWEVDVGNTSNWIIGVCKDFTSDSFEGKKGFVLFSSKRNNHCILSTNTPSVIQYLQRPAGRVGVFLDYENETLSFYDNKLRERKEKQKFAQEESGFSKLHDLKDSEAVHKVFLEEIQLGEELLPQGKLEKATDHLTNAIVVWGQLPQLMPVLTANSSTTGVADVANQAPKTSHRVLSTQNLVEDHVK
ncbi:tripartite motif-containing protein 64-like [Urocitellus parryii]